MVAGCGNKCIKYGFFVFNFLFFVCGASIMTVSIWLRFDNEFQTKLKEVLQHSSGTSVELQNLYFILYGIAAVGALLFVFGFLGCCGACCESVCLLGLFFTVVLTLFLIEIAGVILVFVKKDTLRLDLAKWYRKNVLHAYNTTKEARRSFDELHHQFECCGATGCDDFLLLAPKSCKCDLGKRDGCVYKAFDMITEHLVVLAIACISVFAIETLAMMFSCILCNGIRSVEEDSYYY